MPREVRRSENRKLFRQVNESIATLSDWFTYDGQPLGLVCECVTTGCTERLLVPLDVYARVRQGDATYLVKAGHEYLDHEEVIEHHDDYLIVRIRHELIARRAQEISKGNKAGSDLENWRRAERELSRDPWEEEVSGE